MHLWLAAILFVFITAGITSLIFLIRRKGKKGWMVGAIILLSVIMLALLTYGALSLNFINAVKNRPPVELPEPYIAASDPSASAPAPSPTPSPTTAPTPEIPEAKPDDYDLPTSEVPALCPDILGLRNLQYEEMPTFGTQNEVTKYVLHNFLNERFEFSFYLEKDFAPYEGVGYGILHHATQAAMTYYLFDSYKLTDMYTDDRGDEGKVYARIYFVYTNPEYDLEARAEALEFVMKNPVPIGGFKDYMSEKAYALKIHDYIARKITYSPIGYNPESMLSLNNYQAFQEAYNVLAEEENTAVCAGYARAFALIAQYAGINAPWVLGNETDMSSHAWNIVYPCDGSEPVFVDVTWDDTGSEDFPGQEYVSDKYFYISPGEDPDHSVAEHFDEFLRYVNPTLQ